MKSFFTIKKNIALAGLIVATVIITLIVIQFLKEDESEITIVLRQVEKHLVLPSDEKPALLTVTDSSKLGTQFLKQSQNGDRVLVYQKNRKAVIYRPSIDRIIDIGPVSIDTPQGGNDN